MLCISKDSSALHEVHVLAGLLEHALVKDASGELHIVAIQAMLEVAADLPEQFASLYKGQLSWLRSFLSHTDSTGQSLPSPHISACVSAVLTTACSTAVESCWHISMEHAAPKERDRCMQ